MYSFIVTEKAKKQLTKLDTVAQRLILKFLENEQLWANPRLQGKALQGNLKGLWRYRIGRYRILTKIQDDELLVLVIDVGHRSNIYR